MCVPYFPFQSCIVACYAMIGTWFQIMHKQHPYKLRLGKISLKRQMRAFSVEVALLQLVVKAWSCTTNNRFGKEINDDSWKWEMNSKEQNATVFCCRLCWTSLKVWKLKWMRQWEPWISPGSKDERKLTYDKHYRGILYFLNLIKDYKSMLIFAEKCSSSSMFVRKCEMWRVFWIERASQLQTSPLY